MTFFFPKQGNGPKTATSLVAVLAFLTIVAAGAPASPGKAGTASLFPADCVGGWGGSSNAAGPPDVTDDVDDAYFTPVNSAVFTRNREQILCGGFQGDLADDAVVLATRLRFVWRLKDALAGQPIAPVVPALETIDAPLEEEAAPMAEQDAPVDDAPIEEIVLMADFIEDGTSGQPDAPEDASATPIVVEEATSAPATEEPAPQEVIVTETITPATAGDFEIRYSVDGLEWKSLGIFPRRALPSSLELPTLSPRSLAALRVTIEPTSEDAVGDLYLDGMALEAAYDDPPAIEPASALTESATDAPALVERAGTAIIASRMDEKGWRLSIDGVGRSRGGLVVPDATLILAPAATVARRGGEEDGWQFLDRPDEGEYYAADLTFDEAPTDVCLVGDDPQCAYAPGAFRPGAYVVEVVFRDGRAPMRDALQFNVPPFAGSP